MNSVLLIFAYFLIFFYFSILIKLWFGIRKLKPGARHAKNTPVSVIVAARNEAQKICRCLDSLVNQAYPKNLLEIVIADDGSTDSTPQILEQYKNRFNFFSYLKMSKSKSGNKKQALSAAIKKSTGQILLLTDVDCVPEANWICLIISYFEAKVGLVAGFSPLIDPTDSLLGKIFSLDSLAANVVAAGSIGLNSAATCTGRNLAYRRDVFVQLNGYEEIQKSLSGDDDLFLQLVKRKTNWKIQYAVEKASIVPSYQTISLMDFFKQKKRHLSAGKYYAFKTQLSYLFYHLVNLSLFVIFVYSIFEIRLLFPASVLFAAKLLIDWLLLKYTGNKFDVKFKFLVFIIWEIFFLIYHFLMAPASWFGKIKWKL